MQEILIEKIIVNMGVGGDEAKLKKAKSVIQTITGKKPTVTKGKARIPDWGVRPGIDMGLMVTLRKKEAEEFLKKAFGAKENKINATNFDTGGNFAFGIKEHINLPGIKYDPKVGIIGFDVLVALKKRGYRLKYRKIKRTKVGQKQRVTKEEAIEFVKALGVEVA